MDITFSKAIDITFSSAYFYILCIFLLLYKSYKVFNRVRMKTIHFLTSFFFFNRMRNYDSPIINTNMFNFCGYSMKK